MHGEINSTINVLPPFKKMCMTIGELPASYLETMSYYESLLWFTRYLKDTVIPTINNNAEAVIELQNLYKELENYVNHYFDSLDFQEEINNKLDEMVEDGTLENLLNNRLNLITVYNTEVEFLENKDTLTNGLIVKVLSNEELNDGGGKLYKISTTEEDNSIDLNNGLYANLINYINYNYYDEITYQKLRYNNQTDYYITTIPLNDNDNNQINLYVGESATKTPIQYAQDEYTTLTINGQLSLGSERLTAVIENGVITQEQYSDYQSIPDGYCYIGIKNDRSISTYQANTTTAQDMLIDGVVNGFLVYYQIINNGIIVDMDEIELTESASTIPTLAHPRQCLGIKLDGTIIILTCDGRTSESMGMTSQETASILLSYGCVNAWNLDGGGSTSTIIRGSKLNRNIDGNGTQDRYVKYTLNVKKTITNKEVAKTYSKIGEEKQNLIQQIMPFAMFSETKLYDGLNLNTAIGKNIIGYVNGFTPKPYGNYGGLDNSAYFINITHGNIRYKSTYNFQLLMRRDYKEIFTRRQAEGIWTEWTPINATTETFLNSPGGENSVNSITTTDTYQDIVFMIKETNNNVITGSDFIPDSDERFTSITLDDDFAGYVNLTCVATFYVDTPGRKYLKIKHGSTDVTLERFDCETAGQYNVSVIGMARVTGEGSHKFYIQMYGTEGDYLNGCHVLVKTDR